MPPHAANTEDQPQTATLDRLVDVGVAASALGISQRTLHRLAADGRIAPVRIGRRVLFSPQEIGRFIREGGTRREWNGRP